MTQKQAEELERRREAACVAFKEGFAQGKRWFHKNQYGNEQPHELAEMFVTWWEGQKPAVITEIMQTAIWTGFPSPEQAWADIQYAVGQLSARDVPLEEIAELRVHLGVYLGRKRGLWSGSGEETPFERKANLTMEDSWQVNTDLSMELLKSPAGIPVPVEIANILTNVPNASIIWEEAGDLPRRVVTVRVHDGQVWLDADIPQENIDQFPHARLDPNDMLIIDWPKGSMKMEVVIAGVHGRSNCTQGDEFLRLMLQSESHYRKIENEIRRGCYAAGVSRVYLWDGWFKHTDDLGMFSRFSLDWPGLPEKWWAFIEGERERRILVYQITAVKPHYNGTLGYTTYGDLRHVWHHTPEGHILCRL